jgi:pimeloyl-ACP methyl ester carboxylesterase
MAHPDDVKAVIILAGSTHFVPSDTTKWPAQMTLERRVAGIDRYMAPRWFKTVTRETWDDNNFLPGDYAVNPVLGLRLWREAAQPPLHVWVRYLCEYHAQDISLELDKVATPTLVLNPGLEGAYHDPGGDYMTGYTSASWAGAAGANPKIKIVTIPDSRACLWLDQPEHVNSAVQEFLQSVK